MPASGDSILSFRKRGVMAQCLQHLCGSEGRVPKQRPAAAEADGELVVAQQLLTPAKLGQVRPGEKFTQVSPRSHPAWNACSCRCVTGPNSQTSSSTPDEWTYTVPQLCSTS